MLILGYPRRLAVSQKEVKEVRTVAERLVTESGIPAEFPEETKRGVFLSLLLGVVSIIAALLVAGLVYLFVEIGGDFVGFVQVVGILAFGFSALLLIWSVLLIITVILYRREQNKRWQELSALLDIIDEAIIDEAIIVLREEDRSYLALELKRAERLVERYNDVRRVVTLVERV